MRCLLFMRKPKHVRKAELKETIQNNPFITDEALATSFNVSIQTIRLDRLELGIPELRERLKDVARQHHDEVKALTDEEVIGEVIDLQLDETAISIMEIREEHVFTRNGIARGHHLFAQANSLAVAIINDDFVVTGRANVRFSKPVKATERVVAKAKVTAQDDKWTTVIVESYVDQRRVFSGEFQMQEAIKTKVMKVELIKGA